jgi:hypothetical protein
MSKSKMPRFMMSLGDGAINVFRLCFFIYGLNFLFGVQVTLRTALLAVAYATIAVMAVALFNRVWNDPEE